jgi:hypothetical protein
MEIVQIVPKLSPAISGVGDYAYLLAQQLRADQDINTRFLVCDPLWQRAHDLERFIVDQLESRHLSEFEKKINVRGIPDKVLLHYVGYGYQKRGCPLWLVRGLQRWRARNGNRTLIIMFHELYASGAPWRSSFWTSPIQRRLVTSLARTADYCLTNLNESMRELIRLAGCAEQKVSVLPVFSNVGEPKSFPGLDTRKPRMVVFGSAVSRHQAYNQHRVNLEAACRQLGIEEIVDIGVPLDRIPELTVPCVPRGILPAQALSYELLNARAGFFTYPVRCLGKSTIFAAYAAHGLAPVTYAENMAANKDALRCGEHFLPVSSTDRCDLNQIETISQNAHDWYRGHSITEQVVRYGKIIRNLALQHECRNKGAQCMDFDQ